MEKIKCPKCGTVFQIDESDYDSIVKQVRDSEFEKEIKEREEHYKTDKENAIKLAEVRVEKELQKELSDKTLEINNLKKQLEIQESKNQLKIQESMTEKDRKIDSLNGELQLKAKEYELKEKSIKETYEIKLKDKDEQIAYYKDFKTKQSTKMIGESLEQHCNLEFNRLRPLFKNAYFDKDNDASSGSKGDFIFRDYDNDGNEIVSIMFEMKNEADETASKHKNEDFLKELDKDRREKNCEYAILVSMLEANNDLYNDGIVDMSHLYEKMYVIRPQFFIPIITLIRNSAFKSLEYRQELERIRNQNIDVTHFEENINIFKESFGRNYRLASERFSKAIEEIDKTIEHLQKTKEHLLKTDDNLRIANNKVDDLTIKKLTRNNPTMKKMFEELGNSKVDLLETNDIEEDE